MISSGRDDTSHQEDIVDNNIPENVNNIQQFNEYLDSYKFNNKVSSWGVPSYSSQKVSSEDLSLKDLPSRFIRDFSTEAEENEDDAITCMKDEVFQDSTEYNYHNRDNFSSDSYFTFLNSIDSPTINSEMFEKVPAPLKGGVEPDRNSNGKWSKFKGNRTPKGVKRSNKYTLSDAFYNSYLFAEETLRLQSKPNKKVPMSLPKKMNFRGRRRLRRFIREALNKKEEIILHASFFGNVEQNKQEKIIVDSGTSLHIARDRDDFKLISDERVGIRGATGRGDGFKGILKETELGTNVPCIWFPSLPVRMLLSVRALDRDGWTSRFGEHGAGKPKGQYLLCRRTGSLLNMTYRDGLPCLDLTYKEISQENGYMTQLVENANEWEAECQYCDEPIPKHLDGALVDTKDHDKPERGNSGKPLLRRKITKLLEHQRNCHLFTNPSARCRCFDCLEVKGRKASHDKIRCKDSEIDNPFILFSCDFFGSIKPPSYRKNEWAMVYVCEACGYSKVMPLKSKAEAPIALVRFVREIRSKCGVEPGCKTTRKGKIVFAGIHSDNEPVLRGEFWREAVHKMGLQELHSVPYSPQMNGTCERMVGTVKSSLRTTMHNVDPKVWDYCVEHISKVWNIKVSSKASRHSKDGEPKCPEDIMAETSENPLFKSGIKKRKYLKRFGCLAFFKRDVDPEGAEDLKCHALRPRRVKGIHLGFSEKNSSWIIGTINKEGRFAVYETIDAVFIESILVRNVVQLCKSNISLPVVETGEHDLRQLSLESQEQSSDLQYCRKMPAAGGTGLPVGTRARMDNQGTDCAQVRSGAEKGTSILGETLDLVDPEEEHPDGITICDDEKTSSTADRLAGQLRNLMDKDIPRGKPDPPSTSQRIPDEDDLMEDTLKGLLPPPGSAECCSPTHPEDVPLPVQQQSQSSTCVDEFDIDEDVLEQEAEMRSKRSAKTTKESSKEQVVFGPPLLKRRRGRPPGSKDTTKRVRRTKKAVQTAKLDAFVAVENTAGYRRCATIPEEYAHMVSEEDDLDETAEVEFFLARDEPLPSKPGDSVKPTWAFRYDNPERPSWIQAKEKEQTRLMAYHTWRKLDPEEELQWKQGKLKAVPCALLLNRKRCGRFKARLVVLGNRWKPDQTNSVYASVVSQTGNRAVMTHCAKYGFPIIPFDISNAFVRAEMGDIKVAVKLPDSFCEGETPEDAQIRKNKNVVMLKKALYGLPISPRLWAKTLAKDLASLGWEECKSEPGVYRKWDKHRKNIIAYITVYVDDCIVGAINKKLCEKEVELINKKHPLTRIDVKTDKAGTMHFDMCGADIDYNPYTNYLKISMSNYIDKILKRFDMEGCKPRPVPGFPEEQLYNTKGKPSNFPFKAAVGALQWLATTARPDIAHSTNMLARAGAQPVNKCMERCAKQVFRYLVGTKDIGLEYSKQMEIEFDETYEMLTHHEENAKHPKEEIDNSIHLFTDASFGVAYKTLRSITGVMVYLHGMPIAWKTKVQTIHTSSTTESEWVALAEGIEFSQSCYGLQRFMTGQEEIGPNTGKIWNDNRAVVINARKGTDGIEEIPKKSRHIALRYARVLEHAKRIWFVPTDLQLADGVTKSSQRNPLLQIFTRYPKPQTEGEIGEEQEEIDFSDCYFNEFINPRKSINSFMAFLENFRE